MQRKSIEIELTPSLAEEALHRAICEALSADQSVTDLLGPSGGIYYGPLPDAPACPYIHLAGSEVTTWHKATGDAKWYSYFVTFNGRDDGHDHIRFNDICVAIVACLGVRGNLSIPGQYITTVGARDGRVESRFDMKDHRAVMHIEINTKPLEATEVETPQ